MTGRFRTVNAILEQVGASHPARKGELGCGDYVVVRGTQNAANDKGSFEARFLHLLKYEDGKTVLGEFFTDSAKAAKLL